MKKLLALLACIILALADADAQDFTASGARAAGMAGTAVLQADAYGLFNNPGAMQASQPVFMAAYGLRYAGIGLHDVRVGAVFSPGKWQAGGGVAFFGDKLYNHTRISAAGGHRAGFARFALRANYEQFYIRDYGYRQTVTLDAGGLFSLSPQFSLALVIHNLTRSGFAAESALRLNSLLQAGISWQPAGNFRLDLQLDKDLTRPAAIRLGLEYKPNEAIALRTGLHPAAAAGSLGFGLQWRHFIFDAAGQYSQYLGFSGLFSIQFTAKTE